MCITIDDRSLVCDYSTIGDTHVDGAFVVLHDAFQGFDMRLNWLVTKFGHITKGEDVRTSSKCRPLKASDKLLEWVRD